MGREAQRRLREAQGEPRTGAREGGQERGAGEGDGGREISLQCSSFLPG